MAKMTERVKDLYDKPENVRNIAIAAHIDHGKTTLSDNLLAGAGMMSEDLAGQSLELDFHEDEQERGITIDTAAVSMVHDVEDEDYLINLLDTPGHVDFGGDVTRAMRAVDGCVVLVDAVEGVMPQTETVLKQALRERVKPVLFINKVDRLIKELKLSPEEMQERFVETIKNVNKLIEQIAEEEYEDKWKVNVQDGSVAFGSAFHNWALSMKFMQDHGITFGDIIDAYDSGEEWKELKNRAPLHEVVLNMVVRHMPNPIDAQEYRIPKIWRGDKESPVGKGLIGCDSDGNAVFVITKITIDPQAGEICAGRLFSGTMEKGMDLHLNNANQDVRAQQIYIYNGDKREIVDEVKAGNIFGIGGLKHAYPGETVSEKEVTPFESIQHIFDPVVTKAIEAKNPADLPKLVEVLRQVGKEDPSVKIEINQETGEHLMHGMGELHLEIMENRIRKEKGVDIETSPPIVVYREAVTKESPQAVMGKSPNKHNKVFFKVEPLKDSIVEAMEEDEIPEGRFTKKDKDLWASLEEAGMDSDEARKVKDIHNGNILVDGTRGIIYMEEVIEMIMDTFEDVMDSGPIAHEPGYGIKVTIDDLKLHEDAIHRGPAQMNPAVRDAIRGAIMNSSPLILEPIQTVHFEAPSEYMGDISNLISNKRGQLIDMEQDKGQVSVKSKLPVAEMFGLASELRSATGGRGNFYISDQTYEEVPMDMQQRIIKKIRNRKGLESR